MAEPVSTVPAQLGSVLVVDDDADVQQAARLLLERHGWRVSAALAPGQIWSALTADPVDVILLDLNFTRGARTGQEGFAALARIMAHDPQAVVVVVTGHSGISIAVEAMRAGASDFVMKPWNNARLVATLAGALARRKAHRRAPYPGDAADPSETLLLGESGAMTRLRERIARAAATDAAVLIHGMAGTGKSLIARLLHRASARADAAFVCVDFAGSTAAASAITLFDADDGGAWAQARGGTLVLDEVDAMPTPLQARLAARLEETASLVRLVSTTRATPGEFAGPGLREDLLYRLNTVEIAVPPLRLRGDDARLLAEHFLELFARRHGRARKPLAEAAAELIVATDWPGEVRGLRQAMERCVIFSEGVTYDLDDFGLEDAPAPVARRSRLNLAQSERSLVAAALERHAFNVSRAASDLGLTRSALYRRMAKHGL